MRRSEHALRVALVAGAATITLGAAAAARAQATPAASDATPTTAMAEVVVTANKREERLLDVAASVSAISGRELQTRQALDLQDIARRVPGLNLEQSTGPGSTRIILRGQNAGGDSATVASVLDEAPISFSGANTDGGFLATDFDPYDLSRVEVLRGPQGTLYGATAEGGLIKYVTTPPNLHAYQAGLEAGGLAVAHGGAAASAKGYINVPIIDGKLGLRASGFYEEQPGWIDNDRLGLKNVNDGDKRGARVSLLWTPTSDLSVRVLGLFQNRVGGSSDVVDVKGFADPADPFGLLNGDRHDTYSLSPFKQRYSLVSVDVSYDLHWAKLESISSYGIVHAAFFSDVPSLAAALGPGTTVQQRQTNALNKVSQEVRISSEPKSKLFGFDLDWQAGFFYTREQVTFIQDYDLIGSAGARSLAFVFEGLIPSSYRDLAGYADVTLHLSDRFDIEAGARYSNNRESSATITSGLLAGATFEGPRINTEEDSTTYSFAPRWHITPNSIAYFRVASGYRPGGPGLSIPGQPAGVPLTFHSDSTVNYEGGVKAGLFGGRATADVAIFHIDWSDIQIISSVVVNGTPFTFASNAGKAISEGLEWSLNWAPIKGLNLGAVGAYTDAHLTLDAPGIGGRVGDQLAYVPQISNTLSADYDWALFRDYRASVGVSWTHTGERFSGFSTTAAIDHLPIPAYDTFAAQAGVRNGRYGLEVYAKNLSDERGVTLYTPVGASISGAAVGVIRPRIVGVRVTADF